MVRTAIPSCPRPRTRMETPHSVERNDGFPVTLEIKSSRNLHGCLRIEAGGGATLKQKDRKAKADKITKVWMGR